jgi:hypothetical protein
MRAKGPAQSFQLLLDVAEALDKLKAPFAVVGAYAVSFHGMPRATDDADATVWLAGTGLSSDDLLKNLRQAGFHADLRTGDMDDPISAVLVVKDSFENEVDLILGIRGMDPAARSRSVLTTYQDKSIRIIGAEDLVAMKVFAGGPQDLEDARGILRVKGDQLNVKVLRDLARRFGRAEERTLEGLLKETGGA